MTQTMDKQEETMMLDDAREVVITRVFDAPCALVYAAWTDPEQLKRWYAPNGCTIEIAKFNFRVGGELHTCIRNPKFGDCWCTGVFQEIVVPERLVYTLSFADEQGNFMEPAEMGMKADWPRETTVTVTFVEQGGKTTVTLHQTVLESLAKQTGAYPSWLEMLDRLNELVTQS
ncbi:MAG: SRPBCC domain-containing protein [Capsulimonas sp.]|uniref:SRPBCC family protein n=1 Tax=Capsulimonas sp. TaxID=2494211 RepID=UPI0032646ACD